jgi:hypothetical protein
MHWLAGLVVNWSTFSTFSLVVIDQESNFISEKKSDFTQTMNRLPYDVTEKRVSPWGGLRQTKRRLFFDVLF